MDPVRTGSSPPGQVLHRRRRPGRALGATLSQGSAVDTRSGDVLVLDVVYVLGVIALFALVAGVARAVEKL